MVSNISQDPFAVTIYKLGDTYHGARSNEFGYANYEIIPTPQDREQPADRDAQPVLDGQLGLTQQQRQQILPFLQKEELPKLQALKKNTALTSTQKLEQLKQISDEIDGKISPLLDQQQQQKFQAIREEHRRALVEKMASQVMQKAEDKVKAAM